MTERTILERLNDGALFWVNRNSNGTFRLSDYEGNREDLTRAELLQLADEIRALAGAPNESPPEMDYVRERLKGTWTNKVGEVILKIPNRRLFEEVQRMFSPLVASELIFRRTSCGCEVLLNPDSLSAANEIVLTTFTTRRDFNDFCEWIEMLFPDTDAI